MGIKELLSFLGGMALGGGLCFIFLNEKHKKEKHEEIEELKRYYTEHGIEKPCKEEKTDETIVIDAKSVGADSINTVPNTQYETYANLYKSVDEPLDADLEEDPDDPGYDALYPEEPVGHPYVIDEAAFVNEKSFYDKLGLFYYQGDNTIVNENDEIVDDWVNLIGPDIGARFKLQDRSDEPFSYIYIRNDSIGADFEIALRRESFRGE